MHGPPGSGKTLLASCLAGLLPPLTDKEALEVASIASIGVEKQNIRWGLRPFRAPHHTASAVALIGGGAPPVPGEISLAHKGVLFLDEFVEFQRRVLEVLRQPLESGEIIIARAAHRIKFPCAFQLIAAMNPCPCGYSGDSRKECRCTPDQINRYIGKISGPLLDRIDLVINVPSQAYSQTRQSAKLRSEEARKLITQAQARQVQRTGKMNALLNVRETETHCIPDKAGTKILQNAIDHLGISMRAYHRVLRVARTLADLAQQKELGAAQIAEALSYRQFFH